MSFVHLKSALMKRRGMLTSTGAIKFENNGDTITFEGTGINQKNEPVKILYNGKDLDLTPWLHEETPALITGSKVVKNKNGTFVDCITIVDKILIEKGFKEAGKNKYYGKRPTHILEKEYIPPDKIIVPAEFQKLIEHIKRLKCEETHVERAHESLVEDFYNILGFKKFSEIKWRVGHSDILIKVDNNSLIVNEVKQKWNLSRYDRDLIIQAYNYALEMGIRFVVTTNGDYYAVYDRRKGDSYEENFIGEFILTKMTEDSLQYIEFLKKENFLSYIEG